MAFFFVFASSIDALVQPFAPQFFLYMLPCARGPGRTGGAQRLHRLSLFHSNGPPDKAKETIHVYIYIYIHMHIYVYICISKQRPAQRTGGNLGDTATERKRKKTANHGNALNCCRDVLVECQEAPQQ